jgi:hypothetical protein
MVLSSVSARPNRVSASFVTGGRWITVAISSLLVLLVAGRPAAYAQLADSVRQQALNAFHGPDGQGKDGPLAPVGFDLALLHAQWQAHQAQHPDDPFEAPGSLPVAGGYVTVDATAAQDAKALRDSLEALGMTGIARAGAVVSGRLPIRSIPAAAALANLRALRPARAMTHEAPSPPRASPRGASDTHAPPDSTVSDSHPDTPVSPSSLYWIGGAVAFVTGLLCFLLLRVG